MFKPLRSVLDYFGEALRTVPEMLKDFGTGAKFWGTLAVSLIGFVLAAVAVTAITPRLILVATVEGPEYLVMSSGTEQYSRSESLKNLEELIKKKLSFEAGPRLFPELQKDKPVEPSGQMGLPYLIPRLRVRLEVTNAGSLATTLDRVVMYLVEESNGRRQIRDVYVDFKLKSKIAQGETVLVDGDRGRDVNLALSGALFARYEAVQLIEKQVRAAWPKEEQVSSLVAAYLRLLAPEDVKLQSDLLQLADPSRASRLLLFVMVQDVYGRGATSETEILRSRLIGNVTIRR